MHLTDEEKMTDGQIAYRIPERLGKQLRLLGRLIHLLAEELV